jgi:hypothetical protein
MYYLYKKTHRKTGLQYLGQTTRDPFKYTGSGVDWEKHLLEHGYDVDTEVLLATENKDERNKLGRHYSNLWKVVESKDWANKIPETGGGPGRGSMPEHERKAHSERQKGDGNVSRRPNFKEKHSGDKHWMNREEHAGWTHVMKRKEVRDLVTGVNHVRYDHKIYTLTNQDTNEQVKMTRREFAVAYKLDGGSVSRLLSGRFKQLKGWTVE